MVFASALIKDIDHVVATEHVDVDDIGVTFGATAGMPAHTWQAGSGARTYVSGFRDVRTDLPEGFLILDVVSLGASPARHSFISLPDLKEVIAKQSSHGDTYVMFIDTVEQRLYRPTGEVIVSDQNNKKRMLALDLKRIAEENTTNLEQTAMITLRALLSLKGM